MDVKKQIAKMVTLMDALWFAKPITFILNVTLEWVDSIKITFICNRQWFHTMRQIWFVFNLLFSAVLQGVPEQWRKARSYREQVLLLGRDSSKLLDRWRWIYTSNQGFRVYFDGKDMDGSTANSWYIKRVVCILY